MASSFLHNFVINALKSAIGSMPDFWVLNNSLGWLEKGVLTEADLAELQALIDEKNAPAPQSEPEEEPAEAEAV